MRIGVAENFEKQILHFPKQNLGWVSRWAPDVNTGNFDWEWNEEANRGETLKFHLVELKPQQNPK